MTTGPGPTGAPNAANGDIANDGGATPPFAVLLPFYRGDKPEYVRLAFESVTTGQRLKPAQVVLVQDGPVEGELAALSDALADASEIPVDIVRLAQNRGLAHALNAGLKACRYDIVARQDADDVSLPGRFERQIPLFRQGFDMVGGALQEFADDGDDGGVVRQQPEHAAEIAEAARFKDPFNHPTVVYRRSAVEAVGGYENLSLMEDYLLFARMLQHGVKATNVPEVVVRYRVGDGAYARRGGRQMFSSELRLQRRLRREGFTTRGQFTRNVVMRAGYRLVPESVRRVAYRRWIVRSADD